MINPNHDSRKALIALSGLLVIAMLLAAQAPSKSDTDQITALMASLSDHAKMPADVLDPALSGPERDRNLGYFSPTRYELSIVIRDGAPTIIDDSASVPVRVHYT